MKLDIQNPQPGRYTDLPITDYFAANSAVSRSGLKVFEDGTALDFHHLMTEGYPETDAMRLGSAVDMMVFEPELVADSIAVRPKLGRSKAAVEELARWDEMNAGKLILTQVQHEHAQRLADAVLNARCVRGLMADAMAQESYFWREGDTMLKTRPDGYDERRGVTFDLKTTHSLDDRHLATATVDHGYDAQAAMNCSGIRAAGLEWNAHVLIWVRKKDPIDVRATVIEAGDNWHLFGEARYTKWLRKYEQAAKANDWRGFDRDVEKLPMPTWVARKLEQEEELERAQRREGSAA